MDLFGRFRKLDSSLQRGLDNGFARVFGGEVVPAEIDELLKDQTESSVMMDPEGNRWAPCQFMVRIAPRDYESLTSKHSDLEAGLSDRLQRFIRNSGWQTNAPAQVRLDQDDSLHSGQLKAHSLFDAPVYSEPEELSSSPSASPSPSSSSEPSDVQDGHVSEADANADLSQVVQSAPSSGYVWDAQVASNDEDGQENHGEQASEPARHPGEDAYAEQPVSYPGTEVLASNLHREEPVTGASGERNEAQAEVTLILRDGSDRRYTLRQGSNLIGRGNGVDLRIPDTGVSRNHAEVTWDGYDAVLTDLQSTNGTTVNETPIENWLLADGDVIVLGHSEIEVQFS